LISVLPVVTSQYISKSLLGPRVGNSTAQAKRGQVKIPP
jgi:hypothetical protein